MTANIIDVHGHVPLDKTVAPKMVENAAKNNVTKIFVSSLGVDQWKQYPDASDVAEANKSTFDLCGKHPDLFGAYVYLNPNLDWAAELNRWRDHERFVGVKLWIANKDDTGNAEICLPILERAGDDGFVVLIHSFFRWGQCLPGELSPPEIAELARRVPQANVLMAHMGGQWQLGVKAVAGTANVSVDTSGCGPFRGMVDGAVDACGVDRVLFGSDIPCRTIQSQLHKVHSSNLSDADKYRVLQANAMRLFEKGSV